MMSKTMLVFPTLLFCSALIAVDSFSSRLAVPSRRPSGSALFESSKGKDELNSIRKLLESSWNSEEMGEVPADPSVGASEAFSTIQSASESGVEVFLIDLLLPAYDISQGSNLYDEVLAVEYCIELADCLKGKSSVILRDDQVVQTVSRILDARESAALEAAKAQAVQEAKLKAGEEEKKRAAEVKAKADEARRLAAEAKVKEAEEGTTDNGDNDDDDDEDLSSPTSDVDSFRSELMSSWDLDIEDIEEEEVEIADIKEETETRIQADEDEPTPPVPEEEKTVPAQFPKEKRYRLASMFGNYEIKKGADMIERAIEALRENGMPNEDEENLIILSSQTLEETVAVRSLVNKYEGQKMVILVNCKLDPLPPELRNAETVYSLMPLIAKAKGPESEEAPPKVVVIRRYPKDWEIYCDVGIGFQLADTIPSTLRNKRGIPIEMVTESVKRFLR